MKVAILYCTTIGLYSIIMNIINEDINECDQVNDCHQECQNTVGSFVCSCIEGFILAEDGKNCTG